MCSRRWLSAASKAAGLRRGSDAHSSHHWVAQSGALFQRPAERVPTPHLQEAESLTG